ncbi:DUF4129 domain-containing protein [Lutibacter flavus]|uniref:Protein-glutamine gamma-glutamyltransferase-like C-terminal domain-containing protein n=1 Tax=Lutibacter flavus TaxID=691689 RepID=A0A238VCI0_9FLAO|nr:DUF4129 domain-containing protein [Lutibacter flavus]SNR31393.1 protein of unknown function [Lutibacter flavus]
MNKAILFFLFFIISFGAFSQKDSTTVKSDKSIIVPKKFDKNNLDKYKSDKDFIYTVDKVKKDPTFLERLFNWLGRQFLRFLEWIFGVKYAKGIFGTILKTLPYLIVGILVFLLIKIFLKVKLNAIVSNGSNKAIVSITDEEALIKNKDLLKLIEQAIAQKNYRLAVRYYYLNILKQLESKELIVWEQQKTNEDYIKEISKENIKTSFENLTRLYEFVWYGNFEINEIEFARVEGDFEQTNKLINNK